MRLNSARIWCDWRKRNCCYYWLVVAVAKIDWNHTSVHSNHHCSDPTAGCIHISEFVCVWSTPHITWLPYDIRDDQQRPTTTATKSMRSTTVTMRKTFLLFLFLLFFPFLSSEQEEEKKLLFYFFTLFCLLLCHVLHTGSERKRERDIHLS